MKILSTIITLLFFSQAFGNDIGLHSSVDALARARIDSLVAGTLLPGGGTVDSANFAKLSGGNVFAGTQTAPVIAGGSGTTSTLTIQPTTGVGTTGADIIFKVGTNGGTEAFRIKDSRAIMGATSITLGSTGSEGVVYGPEGLYSTVTTNRAFIRNDGSGSSGIILYGSTHATLANQTLMQNGSATSLTITSSNYALFADSLGVTTRPTGLAQAAAFTAQGVLGELTSKRDKKDSIQVFNNGIELLKQMQPVTFTWKKGTMGEGLRDIGFIAEAQDSIDHRLSLLDKDGKVTDIRERAIIAILVDVAQKQQQEIDALKKQNVEMASSFAPASLVFIGFTMVGLLLVHLKKKQ